MLRYKKHFGLNITPSIVLLQYTYFDETHGQENENYVFDIVKDVGCDVIVEAHFCAGLKDTTPAAIAKGFRGQILCPLHPQCGQKTIEPWMLDEIRKAHELWLLSSIV
jgi:hypothetical protein